MEVSVLNIKGEDTGKKVVLNDAIFGIEPNDHCIYLAVNQYLAAQRQGTHKSKERSERVVAALVAVTSSLQCFVVVAACSVPVLVTIGSN